MMYLKNYKKISIPVVEGPIGEVRDVDQALNMVDLKSRIRNLNLEPEEWTVI